VGIASVCAQAYYDGFAALLFFDQDTVFDTGTLDFIRAFYERNPKLATTHSAVVFNAKRTADGNIADPFVYRDVLIAISSGSLFYLSNVHRIGWHNPTYFVDCVDYEFCLNSNNHGLLVGECSATPGFDHEVEQADRSHTIFGRSRRLRRYSKARITDTIIASTRLIGSALMVRKGRFLWAIGRNLTGYLWWQLVSRILPLPSPDQLGRTEERSAVKNSTHLDNV
jgi:rhamnosyltransferase